MYISGEGKNLMYHKYESLDFSVLCKVFVASFKVDVVSGFFPNVTMVILSTV